MEVPAVNDDVRGEQEADAGESEADGAPTGAPLSGLIQAVGTSAETERSGADGATQGAERAQKAQELAAQQIEPGQEEACLSAETSGMPGVSAPQADDEAEYDSDEEEPCLKYSRMKNGYSETLRKDSASSLAASDRLVVLGTHAGYTHIMDEQGNRIKTFRSHSASVLDTQIDESSEFVASAGMDGIVCIRSLSSPELYTFDFKRPMRTLALEPDFGRRSSRAVVCGGLAGNLILKEKSWFGHKDTILHSGEGPIWKVRWRGSLIAWANDKGVRLYDCSLRQRISFIAPPTASPRGDLFPCSLFWQDASTLLVAWADQIKIAKVRRRQGQASSTGKAEESVSSAALKQLASTSSGPATSVEITAILQLDCLISSIAPHGSDFLVLAYLSEDPSEDGAELEANEDTESRLRRAQRRRAGMKPELRMITASGEELSSDVLSLQNVSRFGCLDYLLIPSADAILAGENAIQQRGAASELEAEGIYYYVLSPKDVILARNRDERDAVEWLLERKRYREALARLDDMSREGAAAAGFDRRQIGHRYLYWLVDVKNDYATAAQLAASFLGDTDSEADVKEWEDFVFLFVDRSKLSTIIPHVPLEKPQLSALVYDVILAHFLRTDVERLLVMISAWPAHIYTYTAVVMAIEDRLKRAIAGNADQTKGDHATLMECLVQLFLLHRQPARALPYFLRLRKPGVFALIRDNNLFTAVQDQALLLVQFDQQLVDAEQESEKLPSGQDSKLLSKLQHHASLKQEASAVASDTPSSTSSSRHGAAISLLVDHTHSIPVHRVSTQLRAEPRYLYMYLDALFDQDPQMVVEYSDELVSLYAEYDADKLMPFLRAMSSYYSFEKSYDVCSRHDYVPEMVFLLGRVGDNKKALELIISRLGDVERAIEFAKEQNDDELWEDVLEYSETRPDFIRGLLENVGAEIDPIRLIRRIKNGLEIPGLKPALIKILSDFNLQVSLLEGSAAVLERDRQAFAQELHAGQTQPRFFEGTMSACAACGKQLLRVPEEPTERSGALPVILFLCRHAHHLQCLAAEDRLPQRRSSAKEQTDLPRISATQAFLKTSVTNLNSTSGKAAMKRAERGDGGMLEQVEKRSQGVRSYAAKLRVVLRDGCPICHAEAQRYIFSS
ncbi:Vacuolar assembly/sorting protein VPS41 [Ceraceosorus bombacis]|uniref:Vacuolar assembly/sorting protein VPS41 n=1 Tax=Ceraceosorus bombacis TaxID=401625 RepID=A0A0P1BT04_9BASI|nr:Vacuolar assembly/sorting protein VPS41 [Ceraceosorus bombacis]